MNQAERRQAKRIVRLVRVTQQSIADMIEDLVEALADHGDLDVFGWSEIDHACDQAKRNLIVVKDYVANIRQELERP